MWSFSSEAYCGGSLAILYYDYALTFAREVEYFWPNPHRAGSWISVIFFLNRYFAILGHIPILISLIPSGSCEVSVLAYRLPLFHLTCPQPQNVCVLKLAYIRLRFDSHKYSWQSHQYSGYFAIALQLLVAGELPVSSTFLGAFHLLVFSALYDAGICLV